MLKYFFKINVFFLSRFFLLSTLICIPFSIQTFLYDHSSYSSGMFLETTSIFLTLTEVFLWLAFFFYSFWLYQKTPLLPNGFFKQFILSSKNKTNYLVLSLILFLGINFFSIFFSKDFLLSFSLSFKIIEGFILFFLLRINLISTKELTLLLILLGIFEGVLAINQFYFQSDLGLYFLGEPHLNPQTLGAAKMIIQNQTLLRGYGTFVHPNLLGAFFVILFFYLDAQQKHYFKYLFLFFLIFTFSRSAFLSIFIGLIIKIFLLNQEKNDLTKKILPHQSQKRLNQKNIFQSLLSLFVFFSLILLPLYYLFPERFSLDQAFYQRLDLIKISWQIFLSYPFGIGNGNFLLYLQDFSPYILKPWNFQPVHNLYLLILNENGALGFIVFLAFLFYLFKSIYQNNSKLIPLYFAILILACFDHYFWDLDQGRWLWWFSIGIISKEIAFIKKLS